jgi:hypothetical protein
MAVNVENSWNTGRVEANKKLHQSPTSTHAKKAENPNVFQTLLGMLKPGESDSTGAAKNSAHSAKFVDQGHHKGSKNADAIRTRNEQSVNNLAASALIAMAATSSGPNRLSGLYSRGGCRSFSYAGSGISGFRQPAREQRAGLYSGQGIGALSAHFESGEMGPGVIGYDSTGGTSYGTYQISSRAGTMKLFVDYLSEKAPDLAGKLKAAGPANTGGCSGKMPEVWKQISASDPARFEKLQYDFIEKSHYSPAVQEISDRTGLDISKGPRALQEVLWSTAVQHGPKSAAKIFTKAIKRSQDKNDSVQMTRLIDSVYDIRSGQFGSSGSGIRSAAKNRFKEEGRMALAMLFNPFLNSENLRT